MKRIVSLVPSLTELLIDLDCTEHLVGRTRFCIHPEKKVEQIPIVGGTKNPRLDTISELNPDLIIANREENRKEDIEKLWGKFRIHLTDISSIEDALLSIHEIGELTNRSQKSAELISGIQREIAHIPDEKPLRVAYFIWSNPWMTVGEKTYIHSVLDRWNLKNVFGGRTRYPKVTLEETAALDPDYIFLSSEPFPFKEKHIQEIQNQFQDSSVILVDAQWFSWYGSRMLPSFKKLNTFRRAIS